MLTLRPRIFVATIALVGVAVALTACSVAAPSAADGSAVPLDRSAAPSESWEDATNGTGVYPTVPGPGECAEAAHIVMFQTGDDTKTRVGLSGTVVDMGTSSIASGEVELDPDGTIRGYVPAPHDTYAGISERFCIDAYDIEKYNAVINGSNGSGGWPLRPGQTVLLYPDPDLPLIGLSVTPPSGG
ncbi:hypothetical protein [Microbacterium aurum]